MKFAFYGRVSTEDQQDPASSKGWQLTRSKQLIEPLGHEVVAEYFDIGQSRSLPWKRRPQAAALLTALADPGRGFDAVVVGEPARAFYGNQFGLTFPVFVHHGVGLWVPEVGGAVDPGSEAHDLVMNVFGGMSKGERTRVKIRVRSAMASQAATEGRFLGGRPPYGYMLGDAGPHPNPSKAAIGQRLKVLVVDDTAAPVVKRIFAEYIAGRGLGAIAEALTADGIPSPSGHDPARNRHRQSARGAWSKSAIRAILMNPRYTGRQVWGKQRKDEVLVDVEDVALGHQTVQRWNDRADWIWSAEQTHEAIVSAEVFAQAADQQATHGNRPKAPRTRRTSRPYMLRRLVRCGVCGRSMEGTWNNDKAHYRCKFPSEYAAVKGLDHPRTVYLRESAIVPAIDEWIADLFAPERLDETCAALATEDAGPDEVATARAGAAKRRITDCDSRLAKYRAALEAGADPVVIGQWLAEVRVEREAAERELHAAQPVDRSDADGMRKAVEALGDMAMVLGEAAPADKAEVYASLGVELVFHPGSRTCSVQLNPSGPCTTGGVEGGT